MNIEAFCYKVTRSPKARAIGTVIGIGAPVFVTNGCLLVAYTYYETPKPQETRVALVPDQTPLVVPPPIATARAEATEAALFSTSQQAIRELGQEAVAATATAILRDARNKNPEWAQAQDDKRRWNKLKRVFVLSGEISLAITALGIGLWWLLKE